MFITLDEAKDFLGITDNASDGLLGTLVSGATAFAQNYLGRKIVSTNYDEYVDVAQFVDLKDNPVTSISGVYLDGELVDSSEYVIDLEGGYIEFIGCVKGLPKGLRLVYTAGYTTIPEDIKLATNLLVKKLYGKLGTEDDKTSERTGDWSISYSDVKVLATTDITNLLDAYKNAEI